MAEETPRSATVERLLEAAEAEFAARGFAQARLEDIAAAVGVRRASLLYHFESKQVLYERVLERAFVDLRSLMVAAIGRPAASYVERLDDVVARSVDVFTRRPLLARLMLRDTIDDHPQSVERGRAYVLPLLELGDAFFRGGQSAGEFREDVEPRTVLLFFTGSIIFHAATSDAQRDVLWGAGRASGRGLRAYREHIVSMVRNLVVVPAKPRRAVAEKSPRRRNPGRAAIS
jgi:AcrR family transcriptional regulator